ncbi:TIGR01777 family oxidoreductase [Halobacillus seohaensis]|uniref:TIGR01777 family oxidoreductase n=1 Tax=Halobacillus seohaensis TaxID=447421 RepID=A0ABW2ET86_9BACI
MKIAITGGTGFVGTKLTNELVHAGHYVYILTRNPDQHYDTDKTTYVGWLQEKYTPWDELPTLDAIVNLAGESLHSGRWTNAKKKSIMDSRIEATEGVLELIRHLKTPPEVLINASAVGFYGQSKTKTFTEETEKPGNDFLANVVVEWEKRANKARDLSVRPVFVRFGIILGENGALPKMTIPYKLMIGGNLGSGDQWMSWIHVDDVAGLIQFAIQEKKVEGPLNGTAPNPKRNKDFGQTLGKVIGRPHWMPAPSFAIQSVLGEMSVLLLEGQSVIPKKATLHGYEFQYPELESALKAILR